MEKVTNNMIRVKFLSRKLFSKDEKESRKIQMIRLICDRIDDEK